MVETQSLKRVLIAVPFAEEKRVDLQNAFRGAECVEVPFNDKAAIHSALPDVDAALIKDNIDQRFLEHERLKWVHCDRSGLDDFAVPAIFESGLKVTSSSGRSAHTLAEHALHFMLALSSEAQAFARAQNLRIWGVSGQDRLRGLFGRQVSIIGFGNTGSRLAEKCIALGMRVNAFRRKNTPSPVPDANLFSRDAGHTLAEALKGSDFLVMAASLNDQSHHLIDKDALAALNPGAILVNVGRALTVDQDAMIEALRSGHLAGAGLDVTWPEPLPMRSPLWKMRRVMITPHVTPRMPDRAAETIKIVKNNAELFLREETMRNLLMPDDVYTLRPEVAHSRVERAIARRWKRIISPAI